MSISSTYDAWLIFQNISNIVFVIMLLVVIFSQVTGVGIDNYGIKKALPKMIVAVIMINLSYLLCQLCVDISNILGNGIYNLFSSMELTATTIEGVSVAQPSNGAGATALTAVSSIALGGAAIMLQGWAIILPLLMGLLSAVIAVIFLFLLLSLRKAAVVVLVVVSPLAFVCYMLPNTKKWFDRWKKAFAAMLLLFPISSLLVGGGDFVSKLLLNVGGSNISFFPALSAMLIGLAPIFLIPTLLKSSFAGLGNLGAKISGMGSKLSGKATGAIKGSDAYGRARNRMIAGGENSLRARIATKTGIGRNSIARARAGVIKSDAESQKATALMDPAYMRAAAAAQESAKNKEMLDAEIANMKGDTGTYAVPAMENQLRELLTSSTPLTGAQQLRAKALMKKMATSGGFAQKTLADIFGKDGVVGKDGTSYTISNANRQFAAKFMASDADVAGAIAKKDGATAQYLRDINDNTFGQIAYSNAIDGSALDISTISRADWGNMELIANGKARPGNNAQFVLDKVVDKNPDFMAQSDGAIEAQISMLSDARLQNIYDDEMLMNASTEGAKASIRDAMRARGFIDANGQRVRVVAQQPQMQEINGIRVRNNPDGTQSTDSGIIITHS